MFDNHIELIISSWFMKRWEIFVSGDLVQGKLPVKVSLTKLSKIFYASSRNSRRRGSEFCYIPQRDEISKNDSASRIEIRLEIYDFPNSIGKYCF